MEKWKGNNEMEHKEEDKEEKLPMWLNADRWRKNKKQASIPDPSQSFEYFLWENTQWN